MRPLRRPLLYIVEAAVAIATVYFLLGGSGWSVAGWAVFCLIAVAIVVVNVLYDSKSLSAGQYERFRRSLGLVMGLGLLLGAAWQRSLVLLAIAVAVGYVWLDDQRHRHDAAKGRE